MEGQDKPQIEDRIARCRLILSTIAIVAVFTDPTQPFVSSWFAIHSGGFTIDPYVLFAMGTHLAYSILVYLAASRRWFAPELLATRTLVADVLLGAVIAFFTEGATSPFYAFFAFAVVVAGFRSGLRQAMLVTGASVSLYLCLIVFSTSGNLNLYIMRPAYLAIVGYLVGYLGEQRIVLQQEVRQLEAAEQRHRIARDLHDGFAQALAGINLRIESCRRMLHRNNGLDALAELTDLQSSVNREYDDLRQYMQSLAGIPPSAPQTATPHDTSIRLHADMSASVAVIDHVLQIAREGLSNVRRHAAAASADIRITNDGATVRISIDDDGIGLQDATPPWSIASRVRELGGQIQVATDRSPGSHLLIVLPQA
jgi:signal transduction histidine kinase